MRFFKFPQSWPQAFSTIVSLVSLTFKSFPSASCTSEKMFKKKSQRETPPFSSLSGKHLMAHMATAPTIGGTPAPRNAPV